MAQIFYAYSSSKQSKAFKKRKAETQKAREKMLEKYKTRYDDVKFTPLARKATNTECESKKIPSLKANIGSTERKESIKYTGNKLIGIATMHKSNMVPVFSQEEA
jgi:hypothetical protein